MDVKITRANYHDDTTHINRSMLEVFRKSRPAYHRRFIEGKKDEESQEGKEAKFFGAAYHCRILLPEEFDQQYIVKPDDVDFRRAENRALKEELKSSGKIVLSGYQNRKINAMRERLFKHRVARSFLEASSVRYEQVHCWRDPRTGLRCKLAADIEHLRFIGDLKTTSSANPGGWGKHCVNFGYHRQAAWYLDGMWQDVCFEGEFVFIAQEKEPPYEVACIKLTEAAIQLGQRQNEALMAELADCLSCDDFSSRYESQVYEADLPPWGYNER